MEVEVGDDGGWNAVGGEECWMVMMMMMMMMAGEKETRQVILMTGVLSGDGEAGVVGSGQVSTSYYLPH
jgi:hypothetical protein